MTQGVLPGHLAIMDQTIQTPDAVSGWITRLPRPLRPWARLARADRPAGYWLLLWPCLWSLALAMPADDACFWYYVGVFFFGSLMMRSAGCVWNDIVDRKLDAKVARTALRPIPAGEVTVWGAFGFAVLLSLLGLLLLLQLPPFAIMIGIASLLPVALYPFAKRVTWWPQVALGLTFNWGALMGWAAARGSLEAAPLVLYAGCLFWTLGYDTIYAHMDRADDTATGIKSTARRLGSASGRYIAVFYALFLLGLALAGWRAGMGWPWFAGIALVALHLFGYQLRKLDIDDPARCLALFRSNSALGPILFLAAIMAQALR